MSIEASAIERYYHLTTYALWADNFNSRCWCQGDNGTSGRWCRGCQARWLFTDAISLTLDLAVAEQYTRRERTRGYNRYGGPDLGAPSSVRDARRQTRTHGELHADREQTLPMLSAMPDDARGDRQC